MPSPAEAAEIGGTGAGGGGAAWAGGGAASSAGKTQPVGAWAAVAAEAPHNAAAEAPPLITPSTAHGLVWLGIGGEAMAAVDPNISDPAIHAPRTPVTR